MDTSSLLRVTGHLRTARQEAFTSYGAEHWLTTEIDNLIQGIQLTVDNMNNGDKLITSQLEPWEGELNG